MESPVKQPIFNAQADKENIVDSRYESDEVAVPIKGIPLMDDVPEKEPEVAPTLKEEEASEPILQENPNRFVLFPIKYHEVRTRPNHVFDASSQDTR
jgi:ribonucleoside-diphosphate reductase subunit M2